MCCLYRAYYLHLAFMWLSHVFSYSINNMFRLRSYHAYIVVIRLLTTITHFRPDDGTYKWIMCTIYIEHYLLLIAPKPCESVNTKYERTDNYHMHRPWTICTARINLSRQGPMGSICASTLPVRVYNLSFWRPNRVEHNETMCLPESGLKSFTNWGERKY